MAGQSQAKGDLLEQFAVPADSDFLVNHDSVPMANHETRSDGCSRLDLHPRQDPVGRNNHVCKTATAVALEPMSHPM